LHTFLASAKGTQPGGSSENSAGLLAALRASTVFCRSGIEYGEMDGVWERSAADYGMNFAVSS
jgi:hypothetical protein